MKSLLLFVFLYGMLAAVVFGRPQADVDGGENELGEERQVFRRAASPNGGFGHHGHGGFGGFGGHHGHHGGFGGFGGHHGHHGGFGGFGGYGRK